MNNCVLPNPYHLHHGGNSEKLLETCQERPPHITGKPWASTTTTHTITSGPLVPASLLSTNQGSLVSATPIMMILVHPRSRCAFISDNLRHRSTSTFLSSLSARYSAQGRPCSQSRIARKRFAPDFPPRRNRRSCREVVVIRNIRNIVL